MADSFEHGVKGYVVGVAEVKVYFPIDMRGNQYIRCDNCEYYSRSSRRCKLNNAIPEFPDKNVGSKCPLERIDD